MTSGIMLSAGVTARHTTRAVNLACIAGLSLLLASWTWTLLDPVLEGTVSAPALQTQTADLKAVTSTALFGGSAVNAQAAPAISLDAQFKLTGIVAAMGRLPGFAVIAVNGQPAKVFKLHDELAPGYRLAAIYPRYVSIQSPSGPSELHFDTGQASGGSSSTAAHATPAAQGDPGTRIIARNAVQDAEKPAVMRVLATSLRANPGQGVQVLNVPAGSIIAALALRPGDLIMQVNGRSMADPQAVMTLPQALQGNSVELVLRRNGTPQTFEYSIQ